MLDDNGGPVETHALLPGSNGIDDGNAPVTGETDARGFLVEDSDRDLGAFERVAQDGGTAGLLSYAGDDPDNFGNDFHIRYDSDDNKLHFFVDGDEIEVDEIEIDAVLGNNFNLFDGQLHSVALSWDNTNGGAWAVYIDGEQITTGSGLAMGETIDPGGTLLFGQEQDLNGGDFETNEAFSGTFFDVRFWDHVRTSSEIADGHQQKLDPNTTHDGLIANWQFDGFNGTEVVDIVSGNNNLTVE